MRRKIASVLATVGLAGAITIGVASTASASTHWSGGYPTLAKCNAARTMYIDFGYRVTTCFKNMGPSGTSYNFWWYDYV